MTTRTCGPFRLVKLKPTRKRYSSKTPVIINRMMPKNSNKRAGVVGLLIAIASMLCATVYAVQAPEAEEAALIWYAAPASAWTEAIPLGNGHLGAMVFGGVAREHRSEEHTSELQSLM